MARQKLLTRRVIVAAFAWAALSGPLMAALPQFDQPKWAALAPEQKRILAPLSREWDGMDAFRRKKWLGIARRYPGMSPAEQASIQRNMRDWARLAPEERKAVREKYKTLKNISPVEKQNVRQKWEEYQALPQEDRDRIQGQIAKRPSPPKTPVPPAQDAGTGRGTFRSPISPLKPR